MIGPDLHPDSVPSAHHDYRVDLERATEGANRDASSSPDGAESSVSGTGGVMKNQDGVTQ